MKLSSKNIRGPDRRVLILVGAVALVIFAACVLAYVVIQVAPLSSLAGLLTGTGAPTQVAQSGTSATPPPPTPTVPVAAPTASSTPTPTASPTKTLTPSPTPTLTRTPTATNIPTMTPTPDPWIVVRDERVGCSSEFTFEPVQAIQVKFQMLSGGGADRSISFSCCGSAGADAFVADHWVPVTLPLPSLKVGQTLETKQFERGVFDRARFYVGCNDGEQMQVRISYLPAPTSVVTPTATLTVTATGTIAPTAAVSVTVTPTATVAITPTSGITSTSGVSATVTPTATAAITPTSGITSTSGVSATVTPTATADITSTSG
ncbi:MAG: hypothetical protein M1482_02080, partial [Chloroflexi bacterium]|nr:hypothetical protein [Chloroflexota bacterium]